MNTKMNLNLVIVFLLLFFTSSCKNVPSKKEVIDIDSIDLTETANHLSELDTLGTGIPIFYNMYLSVELSSLFETANAVFSKDLLNSIGNITAYTTSYKKALNMGVYAVDLSYCRAFEEFDIAGRYFAAMQNLSEQLGIPTSYFEKTAERLESNITHKDSLISIANEVYYQTEEYLKENERFAHASAIIMGGWIEAIYIATFIAIESENPEIIERLADQKYSLNNLLIMLSDYTNNEILNEYIIDLKSLKTTFDGLDIDIPADFDVSDEKNKEILQSWYTEIEKLQAEIAKIRKKISS